MLTKSCSMCNEVKPQGEFHKNVTMPDGLHFYCKSCHTESMKKRRDASRSALVQARDTKGFAIKVAHALHARGEAASWLAKQLGCKADTVTAWLSGSKAPHPKNHLAAAKILGIPVDEIAFTHDERGDFPDGMGCCPECNKRFASYRKGFSIYCSTACKSKAQSSRQFGEENPAYTGGRKLTDGGYVQVLVGADNPMAGRGGYVLEHRHVMAQHLGRPLKRYEVVHHKNGDRQDNRLENLELCGKRNKRHPPGQRMQDVIAAILQHPNMEKLSSESRKLVVQAIEEIIEVQFTQECIT